MMKASLFGLALMTVHIAALATSPADAPLPTTQVQAAGMTQPEGFNGVVEAVRQTVIAAQVAGAVVALDVKAGDAVKAGQVLLRIDARAAEQTAAASDAQVLAARASLEVATKEVERQRQLFQKQYISQAALERAEAQYRATFAQVAAQLAQAGAARTQSGFHVVKAPYSGIVADVPVTLGDMAMPGRPLLTLYDPSALRVTASVPQTAAARHAADAPVKLEMPGLPDDRQWMTAVQVQVLPTIDAATHTAQIRAELPAGTKGLAPGMFARLWLPTRGSANARLFVPAKAVVRRAEMTGLYVLDPKGLPVLRQVRLGRVAEGQVEVLSGVAAGERVVLDPQAAARAPRQR
ncbi:MAG TPA: efflux RND transporter periplasmic adaptor subunit [Noviherbaspirillum sp.]|nr:efflux RND transporter periplasmic adaptor subunit [Noviherbaspirillum sp.]